MNTFRSPGQVGLSAAGPLLAVLALAACASAPGIAPPAPPVIETTGVTAEIRVAQPDWTFVLEDGRTFMVNEADTRILFAGGLGDPFVLGRDATGRFVAVFSNQDGLPDDCHIIPPDADNVGIERGAHIEIRGVLWQKANGFVAADGLPALGTAYESGTRFCFDSKARVFATIPNRPGQPVAQPSSRTEP